MEQGLIYTRLGNPIGMAEVKPEAAGARGRRGSADERRVAPSSANASPRCSRSILRRRRSSSRGAGARWGELAATAESVAAQLPVAGTRIGVLLRNRPAQVAFVLGALRAGACVVAIDPQRGAERVRREIASLELPCVAGEPDDLASAGRARRRRDGALRPRRRRRRRRGASGGARPIDRRAAVSPCRCSRAGPRARPSASTSPTRCSRASLAGAKHYESNRDADAPAAHRRRDHQLAARPRRRPVPRPAVRRRRPLVRAARALHGGRLGRRGSPPSPGDGEPRARGAAHGARGRRRPRGPAQHPLGHLGYGAALGRRRRCVHGQVRDPRAGLLRRDRVRRRRRRLEPRRPPAVLGGQARQRRPRAPGLRAARRRPRRRRGARRGRGGAARGEGRAARRGQRRGSAPRTSRGSTPTASSGSSAAPTRSSFAAGSRCVPTTCAPRSSAIRACAAPRW